jgi:hypothetical protein
MISADRHRVAPAVLSLRDTASHLRDRQTGVPNMPHDGCDIGVVGGRQTAGTQEVNGECRSEARIAGLTVTRASGRILTGA